MTTEEFLACCVANDLTIADLDRMNFNMVIDYIHAFNKIQRERYGIENEDNQHENIKKANQADFNAF